MTQAKHTHGPWYQGTDIRQILADNGTIVCHVSGAVSNPSVLADARLIAAAPDLLEALQLVVDTAENGGWPSAALVIAKATIAKATGATYD